MSAYERKIIHAELADRSDVITESQGNGAERHIVIKPK
jgi:spoIIIJ-associated protein